MQNPTDTVEYGIKGINVSQVKDNDELEAIDVLLDSSMILELQDLFCLANNSANSETSLKGKNHRLEANVAGNTCDLK